MIHFLFNLINDLANDSFPVLKRGKREITSKQEITTQLTQKDLELKTSYKYVEDLPLYPVQFQPQQENKLYSPWTLFGAPMGNFLQNPLGIKMTCKTRIRKQL